jgi:hypothetical protein
VDLAEADLEVILYPSFVGFLLINIFFSYSQEVLAGDVAEVVAAVDQEEDDNLLRQKKNPKFNP